MLIDAEQQAKWLLRAAPFVKLKGEIHRLAKRSDLFDAESGYP